ncbi:MAG: hypothetical protein WC186_01075 [Bacteroidales bacterium]|nr:hypothetical protein [Paludibacter sp.]
MKKNLLILFFAAISVPFMAQQSVNQKEIGLITNNFDTFGLSYKVGSSESLWRFSAFNLSGSNQDSRADSSSTNVNNIGIALRVGKEFRKSIYKNFEFRYGADLSFSYTHSSNDYKPSSTANSNTNVEYSNYSPGLYLVLGVNYVINNKFSIGAELNPGMSYWSTKRNEKYLFGQYDGSFVTSESTSKNTGIGYNFSSTPILFTISYKLN